MLKALRTIAAWRHFVVCLSLLLSGCSFTTQVVPNPAVELANRRAGANGHVLPAKTGRKLFVFLDGTSNDWKARTNVRRLFELVAAQEDPNRLCLWVEGVGTRELVGKVLGAGLQPRIMAGYEFLARNYRPGDEIYIFGFSRGALEARALCGLLAHCQMMEPRAPASDPATRQQEKLPLDQLWEACTRLPEEPRMSKRDVLQLLAENHATVQRQFPDRHFQDVRVKFLGIWDTVPGLQFTKYNADGDEVREGQIRPTPRYKVKPYPNVDRIAHALSMDEMRSQFAPLLVGPPLVEGKTKVFEVWFPGVHSDVGGGYADSNALAGVSLAWMLELLGDESVIPGAYTVDRNPLGIIHHSELNFFGAFGSRPDQRILPAHAFVHRSFLERVQAEGTLTEALDTRYVRTVYRPDVAVQAGVDEQGRPRVKRTIMQKPLGPNGQPVADRRQWHFSPEEFHLALQTVTSGLAEEKPTVGTPIAPAAAQVKTIQVQAPPPVAVPATVSPAPVAPGKAPSAGSAPPVQGAQRRFSLPALFQ